MIILSSLNVNEMVWFGKQQVIETKRKIMSVEHILIMWDQCTH